MRSFSIFTLGAALALIASSAIARAADGCPHGGCASISGTTLQRDGHPWTPKGVQLVGFVAPANALKGGYVAAHQHFGQAEFDAMKSYGADFVRFQISHPGLDTGSPLYSTSYLDSLMSGVKLARQNGFTVVLSVQDQPPSGETPSLARPLPDAATVAIWQRLAPKFASDTGVMYELFNEPFKSATPEGWAAWQAAMQPAIDAIRASGARNIIVVEGLGMGHRLDGAPALHDPTGQLAYGIHPYFWKGYVTPAAWDRYFGDFAQNHVVMSTEWNALSKKESICRPDYPQIAASLLSYLKARHIGMVGFAFDLPVTLIKDFWSYTNYDNFECGAPDKGAGELLRHYYHGDPI
jgi:endoglucanase